MRQIRRARYWLAAVAVAGILTAQSPAPTRDTLQADISKLQTDLAAFAPPAATDPVVAFLKNSGPAGSTWYAEIQSIITAQETISAVVYGPLVQETWLANTTYAIGTIIRDSNGHNQQLTAGSGGVSGATVPMWDMAGGVTSDAGNTWTDLGTAAVMGAASK